MGTFVVVGGGTAGSSAAVELARRGHRVTVLESSSAVGGKITGYCCKATEECARCGVCVAHEIVAEALSTRRIRVLTAVTITGVRPRKKGVVIEYTRRMPAVSLKKCTGCGACVEACPVGCISVYRRGGLVFCTIDHTRCLAARGEECNVCAEACPAAAITCKGDEGRKKRLEADGVVVAIGHDVFDATLKPRFGFGRLPRVITAEEAERLLSTRFDLGEGIRNVAFVQCVGSRDPLLDRNYCSRVCCAYAVRMARVLKKNDPTHTLTVYYIDLQKFDREFESLRTRWNEEGVRFVRGIPCMVDRTPDGGLRVVVETPGGGRETAEHDMLVLSVGMGPGRDAPLIADLFSLRRDRWGFLREGELPVVTAGTCREPQGIFDVIADGKRAALDLLSSLAGNKRWASSPAGAGGRRVGFRRRAAVVGGGDVGESAARQLASWGHNVVFLHEEASASMSPGGRIEVVPGARLDRVEGSAGDYVLHVTSAEGDGRKKISCGAVLLCGPLSGGREKAPVPGSRVVPVDDLPGFVKACPPRRKPRSVALVLDAEGDETKAEMEKVLRAAVRCREEARVDVTVFCREVHVDALPLEELYDRARAQAVDFVKYTGKITVVPDAESVRIAARDSIAGCDVVLAFGAVGMSPGKGMTAAIKECAALCRVEPDGDGFPQANNSRLFPVDTNRAGIFVAGYCRGVAYDSDAERDVAAAVLRVDEFLKAGMPDEGGAVSVDADKCAMCLTCVRVCPHGAMTTDPDKRAAVAISYLCRRCGVCVGECPAGAISLPGGTSEL